MEFHTCSIILANHTELDRLDRAQRWFLHELALSDSEAIWQYNMAPPSIRRRVGLLGFIHKRVLGLCHPSVLTLLPLREEGERAAWMHDKAIRVSYTGVISNWQLFYRSIFGIAETYNRLSVAAVGCVSVSAFQSLLTNQLKAKAEAGDPTWRDAYKPVR